MTRPLLLWLAFFAPCWPAALAAAEPVACTSLPANIVVADGHEAWFETAMASSPTLRRQCRVIAAADRLVVYVSSVGRLPACCRAQTSFTRDGRGAMRAVVALPVSADVVELLAHELEHVVEQIEGLNLRRLARRPGSGVHALGSGRFETERAARAGLTAATEMLTRRCPGACGGDARLVAARD